jgi:hypothetical protein
VVPDHDTNSHPMRGIENGCIRINIDWTFRWRSYNLLKYPFKKYTSMIENFQSSQKITEFVKISRNYSVQTQLSKRTIEDFMGFGRIPPNPLKYTRSKQGLHFFQNGEFPSSTSK